MWNLFIANIEALGFALATLAFFRPELEKLIHLISNKIDFYPNSRIEVGFFDFGPTIGIQFTIRGRGGDQLISSISLKLIRERDGASYDYGWGLFRIFSASQNGSKVEENLKVELATAFLLPKDGSKILNVQFHDNVTKERFRDELLKLKTKFEDFLYTEKIQLANSQQVIAAQEKFKAIRENNDLIVGAYSKIGRELYWEEGRYKVLLKIETDKPNKTFQFQYVFSLTNQEVAHIELNRVGLIQAAMLSHAIPNFVNPEMNNF